MQPVPLGQGDTDEHYQDSPPQMLHFHTVHPLLHFLLHSQDYVITPLKLIFVSVSPCLGSNCVMWGDRNTATHPKYLTKVQ